MQQDVNTHNINAWSSPVEDKFKQFYLRSANHVNEVMENLTLNSKFYRALDSNQMDLIIAVDIFAKVLAI